MQPGTAVLLPGRPGGAGADGGVPGEDVQFAIREKSSCGAAIPRAVVEPRVTAENGQKFFCFR